MISRSDEDLAVLSRKGDHSARNEMLQRFRPMIAAKVRAYSRAPVPLAAIEGEAMKIVLYAAEKFDPKSGVLFKTFLDTYMRGLYRYVAKHQNIARIPEHQVMEITRYRNTKSLMQAQKDREPTNEEMAEALGWSTSQVQKLETSLSRKDIAESGMAKSQESSALNARMEEVLEFEYFSRMTPKEKLVYDYSLGRHGKVRLQSVKDIASRTGLTDGEVYAIKRDLAKRVTSRL